MTAKYFTLGDSKKFMPFNFKTIRWVKGRLGGLNTMNSVLATLRESRFAQSHSNKSCRSLFIFDVIILGSL